MGAELCANYLFVWILIANMTTDHQTHSAKDADTPTKRQQCKELVFQGLSMPQIARIMGVTHNSVRVHVRNILHQEGVSSQMELLAMEIISLRNQLKDRTPIEKQ